jgi:hypothetical protein
LGEKLTHLLASKKYKHKIKVEKSCLKHFGNKKATNKIMAKLTHLTISPELAAFLMQGLKAQAALA